MMGKRRISQRAHQMTVFMNYFLFNIFINNLVSIPFLDEKHITSRCSYIYFSRKSWYFVS